MNPHQKLLSAIFGPKPGEEGPQDQGLIRRMMDVKEASVLAEAAKAGGEIRPALFYGMPAAVCLKGDQVQQVHRMQDGFGLSTLSDMDLKHLEVLGDE